MSGGFKSYVNMNEVEKTEPEVQKKDVKKIANEVFGGPLEPKLLPGELVIAEGHNVLKFDSTDDFNHGISGALFCTNFKISFVTANRSSYDLGELRQRNQLLSEHDIALTCVEAIYQVWNGKKKRLPPGSNIQGRVGILEIHCKDFRILPFSFKFTPKEAERNVVNAILHHAFPTSLDLLFAFEYNPGKNLRIGIADTPEFRAVKDWERELSRVHPAGWRVSFANTNFKMSDTLPEQFIVPSSLSDHDLNNSSPHFVDGRVPLWSWSHPNGSSLVRMVELRSDTTQTQYLERHCLPSTQVVPLGGLDSMLRAIESTHPEKTKASVIDLGRLCPSPKYIQQAYYKLRDLCMPAGAEDFWAADQKWYSLLDGTKWLQCVSACLSVSSAVAERIAGSRQTVVLREYDGRDLSCVVSSLVQVILDCHTRTLVGFQSLVQREWVVSGHRFTDRLHHVHAKDKENEESPVFLLFLDCVWQLLQQFPSCFEFTETYLTTLWDSARVPLFATFLFNSERDRYVACMDAKRDKNDNTSPTLMSVWDWSLQFSDQDRLLFNNPLYGGKLAEYFPEHPSNGPTVVPPNPTNTLGSFKSRNKWKSKKKQKQAGASAQVSFTAPSTPTYNGPLFPINIGAGLKLWTQCYMRWIPWAHTVGGGPPSEYFHQCLLVDELHILNMKIHDLETSKPDEHNTSQDSGMFFTFESPRGFDANDSLTSAFPYSPIGSMDRKSIVGTPLFSFLRRMSVSSYNGAAAANGDD
ncbi:PREDICTED: myotubularin-related protein 10-B-like isoform X1 [Branchiostoma belcheri]|uniref:Myotubularin-related protein 10-B-like isoform X1 n=1 Tax=Branchiostoma belcheri TaxID=7741 RepID=A0A6P4Y4Q3_BRABE|nr:PREDICTED: myotubularin-related protein 10-B-like isoform X1 [Branchiostoma belcheri]